MTFKLTASEIKRAIDLFVSRDVLGVCGQGFKGETEVFFSEEIEELLETITVKITLPEELKEGDLDERKTEN